jgi:pilus assembly protein Flp/PilA
MSPPETCSGEHGIVNLHSPGISACSASNFNIVKGKVSSLIQFVQWMQARIAALRSGAQRGAAAVEYGLLVALIAVAIIAAVILLGNKVKGTFTCVANSLPQTSTSTATSAAC